LPITGVSGVTISWATSDEDLVAIDGAVKRPTNATGDQTVTLTATITKGDESETKVFTVVVKALPYSDADAVADAKAELEISYEDGDSSLSVTKNLTLPLTGTSDTTISWATSDSELVGTDGTVTRPSRSTGDQTVTLTATITKGVETETKTFTI